MKTLTIKPDGGLIKGGLIEYDIAKNGKVKFDVHVTAHYLFSDHDISQRGNYMIEPKLVLSKNVKEGEKVKIGDLSLQVQSKSKVFPTANATAFMMVNGQVAHGTVTIDLSQDVISFQLLTVNGEIFGQSFTIRAEA